MLRNLEKQSQGEQEMPGGLTCSLSRAPQRHPRPTRIQSGVSATVLPVAHLSMKARLAGGKMSFVNMAHDMWYLQALRQARGLQCSPGSHPPLSPAAYPLGVSESASGLDD